MLSDGGANSFRTAPVRIPKSRSAASSPLATFVRIVSVQSGVCRARLDQPATPIPIRRRRRFGRAPTSRTMVPQQTQPEGRRLELPRSSRHRRSPVAMTAAASGQRSPADRALRAVAANSEQDIIGSSAGRLCQQILFRDRLRFHAHVMIEIPDLHDPASVIQQCSALLDVRREGSTREIEVRRPQRAGLVEVRDAEQPGGLQQHPWSSRSALESRPRSRPFPRLSPGAGSTGHTSRGGR